MYRRLLGVLVVGLLVGAAYWSGTHRPPQPDASPDLHVAVEDRNPWTSLRLNNDPDEFKFAVVSDRTGGHRPGVFPHAVETLNLLQPEFVMSVGDLVEGYTDDRATAEGEWREFEAEVGRLRMPFFYVAGNHDVSSSCMARVWRERRGRRYYHFVYRNVLFLALDTDHDKANPHGGIGPDQIAYARKALRDNPDVRWTVVFLHRPLWGEAAADSTGWLDVEEELAARPYTVFAGHVHSFQKYVRRGRNYYQLATTGGGSELRGVGQGEFDQVAWVTMKKDGPLLANVVLGGIYTDDLTKPGGGLPSDPAAVKGKK